MYKFNCKIYQNLIFICKYTTYLTRFESELRQRMFAEPETSTWFTNLRNKQCTWVSDIKKMFHTSNKCILYTI